MPELLTNHPDVTIGVLESQGAQCGPQQAPEILTQCPPEQFCALEGGELCVYGLEQVNEMTQISGQELAAALDGTDEASADGGCSLAAGEATGLGLALVIGLGAAQRFLRLRTRSMSA
jgi:hypothetical protein